MIEINGRTFDGSVIHTPSRFMKGQNRATVTITTSELAVADALELFYDGVKWGISDENGTYYDWSNFDVAGSVSDNRDGSVSIVMGKTHEADLLEILDVNVMTRDTMKDFSQSLVKVRDTIGDELASMVANLYIGMKYDGSLIPVGTRINWNGTLKRAAIDLWDTEENNPDNAPTLWANIAYKDGYRYIPEVITVTTAFDLGECGWWNDELYESIISANTYTPEQYPNGWKLA